MKSFGKYLLIAMFSALLTACVTTAQINNDAARSYAKLQQKARAHNAVDTYSTTAKRIHAVFNKMKPYAEKENKTGVPFEWEVTVVKSDELNALAMPGGKMLFYTGLVDKLSLTDDEIATIMGHEMTHALEEHSKTDRTFSTVTGVLAQVGSIALQTQGIQTNYGGVDLVGTLADLGLSKPFSRGQETEADELGLYLMAKAGYNPQKATTLWKKMAKAGGSGGFFSTHPADDTRQKNIEKWLPKAMEYYQAGKP